ncbi:MAG TPA: type II toxin-antitoxin system HicB family antitoxin [Pseudolabrys sp.]|nr:type II toxin-antitoxin system HicB family antitoxin [Pseudolabrys sp.]
MNVLDYPIQVERLSEEEGGGFAAYAIDLPGCMSDGDTQEAAIENVRDAISEWIEQATAMGRKIPPPTQLRRWA